MNSCELLKIYNSTFKQLTTHNMYNIIHSHWSQILKFNNINFILDHWNDFIFKKDEQYCIGIKRWCSIKLDHSLLCILYKYDSNSEWIILEDKEIQNIFKILNLNISNKLLEKFIYELI